MLESSHPRLIAVAHHSLHILALQDTVQNAQRQRHCYIQQHTNPESGKSSGIHRKIV